MDCASLPTCPFFNDRMKSMPAMAEHMKEKYCRAAWDTCARWMVLQAKGKGSVPDDLFPVQKARAESLIAE
jgi:hypothetical protein